MRGTLISKSLSHYWRTNLAVVAGVAVAVTVLGGALLVGTSVRGSLRELVLQRIGRTDFAVASETFFREELADEIVRAGAGAAAPLIALPGVVVEQSSNRRASSVQIYGVDDRFWRFHGRPDEPAARAVAADPAARDVWLSPALARDIGAESGATLLVRVQRPSDIPLESLHGRKDDLGRTIRLTVREVVAPRQLGEFSLQPQQGDVRAAFMPLARLQQELGIGQRANLTLVGSSQGVTSAAQLEEIVRQRASLEDLGLKLRILDAQRAVALESDAGLIPDERVEAAREAALAAGLEPAPVLTYLANTIRAGDREIPYSLVSGVELGDIAPAVQSEERSLAPLVLNEWAARDLNAKPGDRVTLDYFVWEDPGRLATRMAAFYVAGIVPIAGAAADRDLAPDYPGITESESLKDWDPPFPIDLGRIRPQDEEYWKTYRTTPKAFVPLQAAQALWRSRYGAATSVRVSPRGATPDTNFSEVRDRFAASLRAAIDPLAGGLAVRDVRSQGLGASRGATDFGEYFTYFSFFLVVSAVLLASLFFKLGVEQRGREVGLLRAVGFSTADVRRLFLIEAFVLAVVGSLIGVAGALGYGYLMMVGLTRWWVDAVGTTALTLHVSPAALAIGAASGIVAALACVWWTLRSLSKISERSLLAGQLATEQIAAAPPGTSGRRRADAVAAAALAVAGSGLLALGAAGVMPPAGAFFGAGAALLGAALSALSWWLHRPSRHVLSGRGLWAMSRLGARNAGYRPGRSVLSVAVIAAATFILISVDSFRRDGHVDTADPKSGTGGYSLLVNLVLPLAHDPNSADGRDLLGIASSSGVEIAPFRVLPGDDASCLNLYEPRQLRILGVPPELVSSGRFRFQRSLERNDQERANPWLLLDRELDDEAIPVIADANSMTYVLHKSLGEDIVIARGGQTLTLRLVAALADSVLQGELMMSEANFRRAFPDIQGYQFLLVQTPPDRAPEIERTIEERMADFGADALGTGARLAEFHRVENTYLSTFQTLGGLGLLLGTVGLAAVLLRNVLERRRELALLGAVGYSRSRLLVIVTAESTLLLVFGLAVGASAALIAIAPAALERGVLVPAGAGAWLLLFAVFATGVVSSIAATRAALQARLLDALRAE
jgi:ABC-type lipoprotein release transport system permease subunit